MIDLRDEATRFIYEYGWPVVYLEPKRRCFCTEAKPYSEAYDAPDPNCRVCLGTGWYGLKKIIYIRDDYPNSEQTVAFWGEVMNDERIFFTTWDVKPSINGFFVSVELDDNAKIELPITTREIYNIVDVRDMRADGGRVCYYVVKAKAGI